VKTLVVMVFDSSYQYNMSAFTLDNARKLWLVSLRAPWTSQHVSTTYVYDVRLQLVGTLLITWVPALAWVADILCMCGARPCASIHVPRPTGVVVLTSFCSRLINYMVIKMITS
jgi:hypothetical protein